MLHEAVPFTTSSRPDEFWGVAGAEVPAYAAEVAAGDMLLFNHRIKHSSWGGGDRRRMFTFNIEARYDDAELDLLRQKIAADSAGREASMTRAYGDVMIRTAGPGGCATSSSASRTTTCSAPSRAGDARPARSARHP